MPSMILFSLLTLAAVAAVIAADDCCDPRNRERESCQARFVVQIPERDKIVALTLDNKNIIFADFYGSSFVPFNPTVRPKAEAIKTLDGDLLCLNECDIKFMAGTKDEETESNTHIHMRINNLYVVAILHRDQHHLALLYIPFDMCDAGVPVAFRKIFGCSYDAESNNHLVRTVFNFYSLSELTAKHEFKLSPLAISNDTESELVITAPGLKMYSTFQWKEFGTVVMALNSYGFFCVYRWEDKSSDNVLSRAGDVMPECVPQSLLFGCQASICDSPLIDTIERIDDAWEVYRGPMFMRARIANGSDMPLISPMFTEFREVHKTFPPQIDTITALAVDLTRIEKPQDMAFLSNGSVIRRVEGKASLAKYPLNPKPPAIMAAWQSSNNELVIFSGKTYSPYSPADDFWHREAGGRMKDDYGVEFIDSIFKAMDSRLVILRKGKYAIFPAKDWDKRKGYRWKKFNFFPIPYHEDHNRKGILDMSVCNWTKDEAKDYFDRLDDMWINKKYSGPRVRRMPTGVGILPNKTRGWLSSTTTWIIIGACLVIDVVVIVLVVIYYTKPYLRTNHRNTDSQTSESSNSGRRLGHRISNDSFTRSSTSAGF